MPGSTLATATCSSLSPNPSGFASRTPCSAACIAFAVKVVVTRSPPPSISSSEKPSACSSCLTSVSMWPRWPPYWLCASIFGNAGSFFAALSAFSAVAVPMSAMPPST